MTTAVEPAAREYLSLQELARTYGATPQHWRRLILRGDVPAYRIGDVRVTVRREDVEKYILSRPVTGPVECRDGTRHGKKTGPRPKATAH